MITREELCEYFNYDQLTGIFTWKKDRPHNKLIGKECRYINSDGYSVIFFNKKRYLAHRLAWLYVYEEYPNQQIDHINMIKSDNRIKNLRLANCSTNKFNTNARIDNTSGYKGVFFNKKNKNWQAIAGINGKKKYLGAFDNPQDASKAYEEFAKSNHGEFYRNKTI